MAISTIGTNALSSGITTPSGAVQFFAMNTAPTGWLKANGAAVSRATYASLFSAIGTTFGAGDGSTTFNIPDMRGYFPRGWVDNGTIDSGRAFGSAQTDDFKSHTHGHGVGGGGTGFNNGIYWAQSTVTPFSTNAAGGTETRPYNVALLACIKY